MILDKAGKSVLIVTHECPDPDAIACAIAVKRFLQKGRDVSICVRNNLNDQTRALLDLCGEQVAPGPPAKVDTLIVIDTSSATTIAPFLGLAEHRLLIDHHETKQDYLALFNEHAVDERVVSCSEIVYGLLKGRVDRKTALCLAAGIVTDSANFVAARADTFATLGALLKKHKIDYGEVLALVSTPMEVSERIARLKGGQRARMERVGDVVIAVTEVSSFEGSVANSLLGLGADVSFVGMTGKAETRVAGRCKRWLVDKGLNLGRDVMPELAKILGGDGGGHPGAAGATGTKPEHLGRALERAVALAKDSLTRML